MFAINTALQWFRNLLGKVTYSMINRWGPKSYDCSSAVYYSLIQAGLLPSGIAIGNTDSLFGDLERNGWVKVPMNPDGSITAQEGDVGIWGKRGASSGAAGHTMIFTDADNIIHCSYGYNGIHEDNHDWLWAYNGYPEVTIYRYVGAAAVANDPTDQIVEVGSYIKFDRVFRVDDVQLIGGIWQVRTNELCTQGFTWVDNGIPAEPLVEVDGDRFATVDQELAIGSLYELPGKFVVLDVGFDHGMWLALIEHKGLKFWIDLAAATEVSSSDLGTPSPLQRPQSSIETPASTPEPPIAAPIPETLPSTSPPILVPESPPQPPVQSTPTKQDKPKENNMAFTKEQQKQLDIATKSAQEVATDVANSDAVKEIVSSISKRTKLIVYIIGDTLIGLGVVTPQVAIVWGWNDLQRIVALSGLLVTAGAFLLTMFGIYKSGK